MRPPGRGGARRGLTSRRAPPDGFITPSDGSDDIFVHQTAIHACGPAPRRPPRRTAPPPPLPLSPSPSPALTARCVAREGFRSLKEDEEVEYTISDNGGKSKAVDVTGPGGAFVQGAPRRTRGPAPAPRPRAHRPRASRPRAVAVCACVCKVVEACAAARGVRAARPPRGAGGASGGRIAAWGADGAPCAQPPGRRGGRRRARAARRQRRRRSPRRPRPRP